ncbi:hypothetical protein IJV79_03670, partial [bacterium]|nr:hypothetical protein [bacterium]
YYLPLMSILTALNLYPTDYQVSRWLTADENKVKDFSKYIIKDKFNIGIFWESTKSYITRYTDLKYLLPFGHLDNVQLYNLQIDKEDFECNYPDPSVNVINLAKHFKDFSDTAAAIENLDLVISTDSSVMNLAGALGKKTFGLFCEIPEWRWFELEGESVVWLESVKPFQTKHGNDFSEVIPKISEEIKLLMNEKFNT